MDPVARFAVPVAVFLLMAVVGLELTIGDFRRVARFPRAVLLGTLGQLLLLPLLAWGVIALVSPGPVPAAGLVLIAAAPGGALSNMLTLLARGNVPLSVTLSAVANVLGVLTYPLLAAAGFALLLDQRGAVTVPVGPMMGQLVLLMLLPIGLGMLTRARRPLLVQRHRRLLQRLSLVLMLCIVGLLVGRQWRAVAGDLASVAALASLFTLGAVALGLGLGRLMRAPRQDTVALLLEFATRNTGLAVVVATTTLGRSDYAVFIVAFFAAQLLLTLALIAALRAAPLPPRP